MLSLELQQKSLDLLIKFHQLYEELGPAKAAEHLKIAFSNTNSRLYHEWQKLQGLIERRQKTCIKAVGSQSVYYFQTILENNFFDDQLNEFILKDQSRDFNHLAQGNKWSKCFQGSHLKLLQEILKCEEEQLVSLTLSQSLEWLKVKRDAINKVVSFYQSCLVATGAQNNLSLFQQNQ